MKLNRTLSLLATKGKKGEFVTFKYRDSKGEITTRTIRPAVDIAKRMEKQGTPIKEGSKGNWQTKSSFGLRGMFVRSPKDGSVLIRGVDCTKGKENVFKVFSVNSMSEIH